MVVYVDPARRQRQGLRDPAPGIIEHAAQGADGPVSLGGGVQKGVTLGRSEREASALGVVQLEAVMHHGTD
jgi:hypothetical protein